MAGESRLQGRIIEDLEKDGRYPVKIKLCNRNGFPDVMVLNNGNVLFIEVKDEGEDADPLQLYIHEQLRDQGFNVFIIDTWDKYLALKKRL